jgi:hypothetical protein
MLFKFWRLSAAGASFIFLFLGCQTTPKNSQLPKPPSPYELSYLKLSDSDKILARESVYAYFLLQFPTFRKELQNLKTVQPVVEDEPYLDLPNFPPFHYARLQNGTWRFDFDSNPPESQSPTQPWEWVLSIEVGGWLISKHFGFQNDTKGSCIRYYRKGLRQMRTKTQKPLGGTVFDPSALKTGPELGQVLSNLCLGLGMQTLELIKPTSNAVFPTATQNPQYEAWLLKQTEIQSQKILSGYQAILL